MSEVFTGHDSTADLQKIAPGTIFRKSRGAVVYVKIRPDALNPDGSRAQLFPYPDGSLRHIPYEEGRLKDCSIPYSRIGAFKHKSQYYGKGTAYLALEKSYLSLEYKPSPVMVLEGPREVPRSPRVTYVSNGRIYIEYDTSCWMKGTAWVDLCSNPPPELERGPGISRQDNPYIRKHDHSKVWRWVAYIPSRYDYLLKDDTTRG